MVNQRAREGSYQPDGLHRSMDTLHRGRGEIHCTISGAFIMTTSPQVIDIGVLLIPGYQWLDASGPIDYINNHSHDMVKLLTVPETLLAKAPIINWHYISSMGNLEQVPASSGPPHVPTTTFIDCPTIDYLGGRYCR